MSFGRTPVIVVATACLASCSTPGEIWVQEGSTAAHLVFRFGQKRDGPALLSFGGLRVDRCEPASTDAHPAAIWILAPANGDLPIDRVTYGEAPEGYRSVEGPYPLVPGCYIADSMSGGSVRFLVTGNGSVLEWEFRAPAPDTSPP